MITYLECSCCGDDGAQSDADGMFYDGEPLICGCPGSVSIDDNESGAYIHINDDEPCPTCDPEPTP